MTSNELNEILNNTRRTKEISLSAEQVEELVKDLEVLEILKKVLLKLNAIAEIVDLGNKDTYTIGDLDKIFFYLDNKEEYELVKGWLENDK